jgi:hypothetical protein
MKKILLTSFCAAAMAAASYGQGFINWGTISPTFMTAQTNSTQYSPLTDHSLGSGAPTGSGSVGATVGGGAQFYYALLFTTAAATAPTTVSGAGGLSSWNPVTLNGQPTAVLMATNANSAGRVTSMGTAGENVNIANGTTYSVMLVGWSVNLGTTWATVLGELQNWQNAPISNAYFGMSAEGQYSPGAAAPGNSPFGASPLINSPNTQIYLLQTVPEPGTLALAALGGASLLLFRRKK